MSASIAVISKEANKNSSADKIYSTANTVYFFPLSIYISLFLLFFSIFFFFFSFFFVNRAEYSKVWKNVDVI